MDQLKIVSRYCGDDADAQVSLPWRAFYEGQEGAGNFGVGMTEEEAIADFKSSCQEDHDRRLKSGK